MSLKAVKRDIQNYRLGCHMPLATQMRVFNLFEALLVEHCGIAPVCATEDSVRRAQKLIDDYDGTLPSKH